MLASHIRYKHTSLYLEDCTHFGSRPGEWIPHGVALRTEPFGVARIPTSTFSFQWSCGGGPFPNNTSLSQLHDRQNLVPLLQVYNITLSGWQYLSNPTKLKGVKGTRDKACQLYNFDPVSTGPFLIHGCMSDSFLHLSRVIPKNRRTLSVNGNWFQQVPGPGPLLARMVNNHKTTKEISRHAWRVNVRKASMGNLWKTQWTQFTWHNDRSRYY